MIHCDNMAVVSSVNGGSSKTPELMVLIRELYFQQVMHNFEFRLLYVKTSENIADLPSRMRIEEFQDLYPDKLRIKPDLSELF